MIDPKVAARELASRLHARGINIKHVQALDLVAAGLGFASRLHLASTEQLLADLPINARLLRARAKVLAAHDLDRRAQIIEVAYLVLAPPATLDAGFVIARDDRDGSTLFWSNEDGWVDIASASRFADVTGRLPTAGLDPQEAASVRYMAIGDARIRAAIDAAVIEIAEDEPCARQPDEDPIMDYDRIAAIIARDHGEELAGRPLGPLELALRDGAERISRYVSPTRYRAWTAGDGAASWVKQVSAAFASAEAPTVKEQRTLLSAGLKAIDPIRAWFADEDLLRGWINVAHYPGAIDNEIDPHASGISPAF